MTDRVDAGIMETQSDVSVHSLKAEHLEGVFQDAKRSTGRQVAGNRLLQTISKVDFVCKPQGVMGIVVLAMSYDVWMHIGMVRFCSYQSICTWHWLG